jgi:hypothetical protein
MGIYTVLYHHYNYHIKDNMGCGKKNSLPYLHNYPCKSNHGDIMGRYDLSNGKLVGCGIIKSTMCWGYNQGNNWDIMG